MLLNSIGAYALIVKRSPLPLRLANWQWLPIKAYASRLIDVKTSSIRHAEISPIPSSLTWNLNREASLTQGPTDSSRSVPQSTEGRITGPIE